MKASPIIPFVENLWAVAALTYNEWSEQSNSSALSVQTLANFYFLDYNDRHVSKTGNRGCKITGEESPGFTGQDAG